LAKPCTYTSRSAKGSSRARNNTRSDAAAAAKPQPQEAGPQQQPSPQSQTQEQEQETERELSPKAQQDVASLVTVQTNADMDFDVESMIAWPTPDFSMNDTGSSHAPLLDQLPSESVATLSMYHDSEGMAAAGVSTAPEPWLNNFNATTLLPSDFRSWPRVSNLAHPLAITMSRISESESMDMSKLFSSPASTTSARHLIKSASSSTSLLEQCSCLQHIAFLVHDLETTKVESLDGKLGSHKEAVDYGRTMLMCSSCSRRPENLLSLTFLSDRLLKLSETVVEKLANCDERPPIVFGELEIDSAPEWELLVSSLVMQHLSALHQLMGQFKRNAETVRADVVYQKATETEKRTGDLIEKLYHRFGRP
jgi:hypothetical protein